ncbi:MAG: 4Fe-4S binding protein [Abitibacteriaceae bacterium]|nr:4Fe-4S binding protein [Abditibacteriaceae bacterium]
MAGDVYVIAEPCVGVKDKACVEVCPMDCIHGEESDPQLYINPNECIICGACEVACPVGAIFEADALPAEWKHFEQINADYYREK